MYLRKFFENEYNKKNIKTLLCTNTLMEGINTPTEELIIVDNPNTPFELNNLIGRVGRLNVKTPTIGKVILCNQETLNNLINTNTWMDLKILAEEQLVGSNDEVLYLNKKYEDEKKKEIYNSKLNMLKENYEITEELMIEKMVEFDKSVKFAEEGIIQQFLDAKRKYDCVVATINLLGGPSYNFQKDKYNNIKFDGIKFLPYKVYITKLLMKYSYKELIEEFNETYNEEHDLENINIFIDSLYDLNSYIKFKFSKIVNYIELFGIEESSQILKEFKNIVSAYSNMDIAYKILEDLGIEEIDIDKIIKKVSIDNNVSTSSVIELLRKNKELLMNSDISPFSKNNIQNL